MGGRSSREVIYQSDPALTQMISTLSKELEERRKEYDRISKAMEEKEIHTFEDLRKADANMACDLLKLAVSTSAAVMDGHNVGFFGHTSVGKSYLLNSMHGSDVAATGPGETTTVITKYPSSAINLNLWDIPGKNDDVNFYRVEYISCIKGLSIRVVMVSATLKEMSKVIGLFQQLQLPFVLVVNKCDLYDENELAQLKVSIQAERDTICPHVPLFFVSAKKPSHPPTKNDFRDLVLAISPNAPGGALVAADSSAVSSSA